MPTNIIITLNVSWRSWRLYIYERRTEIRACVESKTERILLWKKPSLPFASCACVLGWCGRMMGRGLGRGKGRGVMGRAAVHPSALYPQSKHDKWEPSLAWLKMKTRIHLHPKSLAQGGKGWWKETCARGHITFGLAFYALSYISEGV